MKSSIVFVLMIVSQIAFAHDVKLNPNSIDFVFKGNNRLDDCYCQHSPEGTFLTEWRVSCHDANGVIKHRFFVYLTAQVFLSAQNPKFTVRTVYWLQNEASSETTSAESILSFKEPSEINSGILSATTEKGALWVNINFQSAIIGSQGENPSNSNQDELLIPLPRESPF